MAALEGIVASGVGDGARFMAIDWVREAVRRAVGFDPYPGTLNVRLVDGESVRRWRALRERAPLRIAPPGEGCGGWLVPLVVEPDVPAAVVVPDVTRHGDEVLEIVAAVSLRARLGLHDGAAVRLTA
jgi:CTP-dependent riboflavin kinase